MRNRWPILSLLCALASLLVPGIASASTTAGAGTRVLAFDLARIRRQDSDPFLTCPPPH